MVCRKVEASIHEVKQSTSAQAVSHQAQVHVSSVRDRTQPQPRAEMLGASPAPAPAPTHKRKHKRKHKHKHRNKKKKDTKGKSEAAAPVAPAYTPTHRYAEQCLDSHTRVKNMVYSKEGWEPFHEAENVTILRKVDPSSPLQQVKGMGRIEAPPRAIAEIVRDIGRKHEYDGMLDSAHVVETLDEHTMLNYSAFKRKWPTTARDFLTLQYEQEYPDGTIILAFFSVDDDACPVKKSHVRASVEIGAWILSPVEGNPMACDAIYAAQVDLGGSLPTSLVNSATSKAPMCIDGVRPIVAAIPSLDSYVFTPPSEPEPEPEAEPEASPQSESDSDSDSDVGSEPGVETVEASAPESEAVEAPESEGASSSGPSSGPSSSLPAHLNSIRSTGVMAAMDVSHSAEETAHIGLHNYQTEEIGHGWTFVNNKNEILTYRKKVPNNPIHAFLGKGIIPLPPRLVFQTLTNPSRRFEYDRMLKDLTILNKIDEETRVMWMLHSTKRCLMEHARDMVIVHHHMETSDGALIAAGRSVSYPDCPVSEDVVRAEVYGSGWYLKEHPTDPLATVVTYITQVNVGAAPAKIINIVSVKQPQSIHHLREFLLTVHKE